MRKVSFGLFCVCAAVIFYFLLITFSRPSISTPEQDYKKASELVAAHQPEKALHLIAKYRDEFKKNAEQKSSTDWLSLSIEALKQMPDGTLLLYGLYEQFPAKITSDEDASLRVAEALLSQEKLDQYAQLKKIWEKQSKNPVAWFLLDGDLLVKENKPAEALKHFNSQTLSGKDETARLLRLALLVANENLEQSWQYLTMALQKDPGNSDIRSFRAQILERTGQLSMARAEYIAAWQQHPEQPLLADQLGEFYRRHGQIAWAIDAWRQAMVLPGADKVWLKVWFWSHVVHRQDIDWSRMTIPEGSLHPLLYYLQTLPTKKFWDDSTFAAVSGASVYLQQEQAVFWLRLLQFLKEDNQREAWKLALYNPFAAQSWNPDLLAALKLVLLSRGVAEAAPIEKKNTTMPAAGSEDKHQFFKELSKLGTGGDAAIDEPTRRLLQGPDAYTALLLASGWLEGALQLNKLTIVPPEYPDWFAFGLVQAMRFERGNQQALDFALKQKQTPPLELLTGELMLDAGDLGAGLDKLLPLVGQPGGIGARAALLSTNVLAQQGEYQKARETLEKQPDLAHSVLGKELLARIALLQKDTEAAEKIYAEILPDSEAAQYYYLKKSIESKNWTEARKLVNKLLKEYPLSIQLQEWNILIKKETEAKESAP